MKLLITGATGRCGSRVVSELVNTGHILRALTRDPNQPKARALEKIGVEVVQGDMLRPESLPGALKDIERAYLITTPQYGIREEEMAGCNFIHAAVDEGISYLVFQSVIYAETEIPHFATKGIIERKLAENIIPWASLRAGYFLDTLPSYLTPEVLKKQHLQSLVQPDLPVWWVSIEDLARIGSKLLTAEPPLLGCFDAVSPEPMSFNAFTQRLAKLTGSSWQCHYTPVSIEELVAGLVANGFLDEVKGEELLSKVPSRSDDYYALVNACSIVPNARVLEQKFDFQFCSPFEVIERCISEI